MSPLQQQNDLTKYHDADKLPVIDERDGARIVLAVEFAKGIGVKTLYYSDIGDIINKPSRKNKLSM